jgi:hypothetical protein
MPEYTFCCENCKNKFSIICSIKNYKEKNKCTNCKSSSTYRLYSEDLASLNTCIKLADSEVKTLGHLANRNTERLSEDHKASLNEKHNSYRETPSENQLPSGMSRIQKPKKKTKWT